MWNRTCFSLLGISLSLRMKLWNSSETGKLKVLGEYWNLSGAMILNFEMFLPATSKKNWIIIWRTCMTQRGTKFFQPLMMSFFRSLCLGEQWKYEVCQPVDTTICHRLNPQLRCPTSLDPHEKSHEKNPVDQQCLLVKSYVYWLYKSLHFGWWNVSMSVGEIRPFLFAKSLHVCWWIPNFCWSILPLSVGQVPFLLGKSHCKFQFCLVVPFLLLQSISRFCFTTPCFFCGTAIRQLGQLVKS